MPTRVYNIDIFARAEDGTMSAPPVEGKLAATFAADIDGYSRLMAHDEVSRLGRLQPACGQGVVIRCCIPANCDGIRNAGVTAVISFSRMNEELVREHDRHRR
jgi:hypothetical protein